MPTEQELVGAALGLCGLGGPARDAPVPCDGVGRVRRKLVAAVPSAIGPVVLQPEQAEAEQAEAEQAEAEQAEQAEAEQAEQAEAEQAEAEPAAAEQAGAEQAEQAGAPQLDLQPEQAQQPEAERRCKRVAEKRIFQRYGCASAGSLAQQMQIDTTAITDYNWQFEIETGAYVNENGMEQDSLFNARNALMAFVPRLSKQRSAVDKALAQINNAVYPSLHVYAPDNGAREMFMDIEDLGQLLRQHIVRQHIVQAGAAGAAPAAASAQPEQQAIALEGRAPIYKQMTVYIGGAQTQITQHCCLAGDLADTFRIDTTVIPQFQRNAEINKIVHGPPDLQGKWDLVSVMKAFNPTKWTEKRSAVRALAKTNMEIYSSRTELQMRHYNVRLLNFLYQSY